MTRILALLLFCLLPLAAMAQANAPVEGEDYLVIADGQPWQPRKGGIEVVEVFAYWCPHCADFEPLVEAWKRTLPRDVHVSDVPAAYDPGDPYSRAFFAAEQLGVLDRTHAALFDAIHRTQTVPRSHASADELAAFYARHGVNAATFKAAMSSPAVDAKMQRARDFILASGLEGTPTLIIDGKYRVQGRSFQDALRIAGQLIAMERADITAAARKR